MNEERLILGIDPGYGRAGYAVVAVHGSALQLVACDGQLDAESLRRHDVSQARRQRAEQLVTVQMAADRTVDREQRGELVASELALVAPELALVVSRCVRESRDRGRGGRGQLRHGRTYTPGQAYREGLSSV